MQAWFIIGKPCNKHHFRLTTSRGKWLKPKSNTVSKVLKARPVTVLLRITPSCNGTRQSWMSKLQNSFTLLQMDYMPIVPNDGIEMSWSGLFQDGSDFSCKKSPALKEKSHSFNETFCCSNLMNLCSTLSLRSLPDHFYPIIQNFHFWGHFNIF